MRLDKKLNLVLPLDYGGRAFYVHAAPVSREVFESNFMIISKTFARIHAEGLSSIAGPRIAYLMLRAIAQEDGAWDGPTGVNMSLVAEIVRLTNFVMPGERGWETIPFQSALDEKKIDDEDRSEVLNALVFFTVASAMYPARDLYTTKDQTTGKERVGILSFALSLWGGQTSSSNCTEFAASLPTSTPGGGTGKRTAAASQVPS